MTKKPSWITCGDAKPPGTVNPRILELMMPGQPDHDIRNGGEHRQKTIIGLWEFITRYKQGQGVQVTNVWHKHASDRHLGVLEREAKSDNPWRCPHCGAKPPDGGLMIATLKGAPLL